MVVITWNIQWGRGADGRVDLERIVDTAREMADFDVLCLQEVADNYPGLEGAGTSCQYAELAKLLPLHCAIEGVAVDRYTPGIGHQRFGNMMFTREAPIQVLRHQLPWPADATEPSMPRQLTEAVLPSPGGPVRVMTTHLEYYAAGQRAAQIEFLRELQAEASRHRDLPRYEDQMGKPFETRQRGSRAIVCGDFNCGSADPMIARLQQPLGDAPAWRDAWAIAHPGEPHPMTLGLYDRQQWPDGPQSFDFFFVSADLADRVKRVEVNPATQYSDHQPVLLEIDT
ncbi:MAG TPA: endonuclease/exonuclease/phosphatase family protein [Ramlibacter sp.]|uniref:endonuclease/exonuclease/phosphatase family protein n=1 Tax=Ramlibacter sp. TaxID=1917967 RepID=UPI002C4B2FD1|nr:endonuclease/exonuclease/phosphatase family protein [Ramlibacter sp.]HVZ42502.1 endonuclease/exonuclease/phosphatase family protein [Ramlibacter sp.]